VTVAWAEQKRTRSETVKRWLVMIADIVELWPALDADDQETAWGATTPAGAVAVMVGRDIRGADVQRAVVAGLPNVPDEDWATAARQIREFATRVRMKAPAGVRAADVLADAAAFLSRSAAA